MSTRKLDPYPDRSAANSSDHRLIADLLSPPGLPDFTQLSALQAELQKTEPAKPRWPILLLIPVGASAVVATRAWLGERSLLRLDLAQLSDRLSWGVAGLALCAALALAAALYRGRKGFGLSTRTLGGIALALGGLVAGIPLLLRGTTHPALHALGAPCAAVVLSAGALALGALGYLFRRTQPVAAQARALLLGTVAAAWTAIVISLHCPGETTAHLLWGHSAPLLMLVAFASWLLPRQLQP